MTQKLIYIAGPFRADNHWLIHKNVEKAMDLALKVWQAGHVAICPHANTMFYQGTIPDDWWLQGDLVILKKCDTVVMVEGWEGSKGARGELDEAYRHHIPIFYDWEGLKAWFLDLSYYD